MLRTFGSDPEFLLVANRGHLMPKSAIGVVQGDIENRINLKGHQFYYDNVLAECAVKPGASKEETIRNFREVLQLYADMVSPFKLTTTASVIFPDSELTHPDARKVGCAKDMCAYELKQKDGPVDEISHGNLRSCGGHIHVGAESIAGDGPEPILFIYMMDLVLGCTSLWLDKDPTSKRRRELYGQAGRYRVKDYGMEYRSLGNYWLNSPELAAFTYDLTMYCLDMVECGAAWELWEFSWDRFFESESGDLAESWQCKAYDPEALRNGINATDKNLVEPHYALVKAMLTADLRSELERLVAKPYEPDVYKNWSLN